MSGKQQKQAIVIIHGIGEQRPILTLRGFVESVARHLRDVRRQARQDEAIFWDKPDPVSGNYETRKMEMRKGKNHPSTHFYEFYWAHHMRDTNFSHVKAWLQRVVFRLPQNVSKRLLGVFFFLWFLFLLIIVSILAASYRFGPSLTLAKIISIITGVAGTFILGFLSHFLFNYLGDAARYLDPTPGNIGERQAIRSEGMALLKGLHDSKKYERIVIIAHSLGATIAYDLIKLLWAEYYYKNDPGSFGKLTDKELDDYYINLQKAVDDADALDGEEKSRKAFMESQQQNAAYLKAIGNPWLISDLVTMGSPLTHAGHLFAQEKGLFDKLKLQREYPTCPPYIQPPDRTWLLKAKNATTASGKSLQYFNHSSPFAATRWTNIYYNTDFIGGPAVPLFGNGIRDIEIKRKGGTFVYPVGHTKYWDFDDKNNVLEQIWAILENKEINPAETTINQHRQEG